MIDLVRIEIRYNRIIVLVSYLIVIFMFVLGEVAGRPRLIPSYYNMLSLPVLFGLIFIFLRRKKENRDRGLMTLPVKASLLSAARLVFPLLYVTGAALLLLVLFVFFARDLLDGEAIRRHLYFLGYSSSYYIMLFLLYDLKSSLRSARRWLLFITIAILLSVSWLIFWNPHLYVTFVSRLLGAGTNADPVVVFMISDVAVVLLLTVTLILHLLSAVLFRSRRSFTD